jgi:Rap1a immunity proteins
MTGRWTVCCSFFILILTSDPTVTFAQNQIDDEARSATAGCREALTQAGQLQTFDAGMCLGILKGLHYLSKDICIPPATSLSQIGEIVSQYLNGHAGEIHDDFQETALDAMRSAWPCGGRSNI